MLRIFVLVYMKMYFANNIYFVLKVAFFSSKTHKKQESIIKEWNSYPSSDRDFNRNWNHTSHSAPIKSIHEPKGVVVGVDKGHPIARFDIDISIFESHSI